MSILLGKMLDAINEGSAVVTEQVLQRTSRDNREEPIGGRRADQRQNDRPRTLGFLAHNIVELIGCPRMRGITLAGPCKRVVTNEIDVRIALRRVVDVKSSTHACSRLTRIRRRVAFKDELFFAY